MLLNIFFFWMMGLIETLELLYHRRARHAFLLGLWTYVKFSLFFVVGFVERVTFPMQTLVLFKFLPKLLSLPALFHKPFSSSLGIQVTELMEKLGCSFPCQSVPSSSWSGVRSVTCPRRIWAQSVSCWCDPPEEDVGRGDFAFVTWQACSSFGILVCPHYVLFICPTSTFIWMEFQVVFAVLQVLGFTVNK